MNYWFKPASAVGHWIRWWRQWWTGNVRNKHVRYIFKIFHNSSEKIRKVKEICNWILEFVVNMSIWDPKHTRSFYIVLITNEMYNSYNQFLFHSLLYKFRTNLVVHHQEHGIIYCITQFGTIGTIVQASLDSSARLNNGRQREYAIFITYCFNAACSGSTRSHQQGSRHYSIHYVSCIILHILHPRVRMTSQIHRYTKRIQ